MAATPWMIVSAALLAVAAVEGSSTRFYVRNRCSFQAFVQTDMGGRNLEFSNGFTLDPGSSGTIPVEGDTPLTGYIYVGNRLPATLAEFHLNYDEASDGSDNFYRINLENGFNVGVEIAPTDPRCRTLRCNINMNQCPAKFAVNEQQACNAKESDDNKSYVQAVRDACPGFYKHHSREVLFSCPSSSDYTITFCP